MRRWREDTTAATQHDSGGSGGQPAFPLPTWAPLPARPDPGFDQLAADVAADLGLPWVAVILVSKAGQVFPGAFGLPEPLASERSMPLSHSLSQRVALTGEPLVLPDVRTERSLADRPSVTRLGLAALLAVPLADQQGRPLGALAAADRRPHDWRPEETATLQRWAGACSRLLQFRILELAERESRAAAVREDAAARAADAAARSSLLEAEAEADRTRVVARLSAALLDAASLTDVLRLTDRLVRSPLGAAVAALGVTDSAGSEVRVWTTATGSAPLTGPAATLCLADAHPLAAALRGRRPVVTGAGDPQLAADLPGGSCAAAVAVPLALGQHDSAGALLVGWRQPRAVDAPVRRVVDDLAVHVGLALDRVLLRDQLAATGAG